MNMKMLKAAIAGLVLSLSGFANAGLIGVDLTSASNQWTVNTSNNWTLGYEFSISSEMNVSALGFWDLNSSFGNSSVGLWDSNGILVGSVNSNSATVNTFATSNNHGTWNFMDINLTLAAGTYNLGSWSETGMEYTYNPSSSMNSEYINSAITITNTSEKSGGFFQNPTDHFANPINLAGIFGANIMFDDSVQVPEPSTVAIFAISIIGLVSRRLLLVNKKQ